MSPPAGHEREPDRAALDELERAFARRDADAHDDRVPPDDRHAAGSTTADPAMTDPPAGEPSGSGSPTADPADGDPADGDPAAGEHHDGPRLGGRRTAARASTDAGQVSRVGRDGADGDVPEFGRGGDVGHLPGVGRDGVDGDVPEFGPGGDVGHVPGAGRDGDDGESSDTPVDVPAAAPPIIRIDGYGGSSEIVVPPADRAATASAGRVGAEPAAAAGPIVIAVDDDLPDAVYVEGSLDQSGSRSIVFIEDDGSLDALQPESERDVRRGVEPRMRERRVAVKRAAGRKRLRWILGIAAVVLLVVVVLSVLGSSLFAVRSDQVVVTGNVYTDPARLQQVVDDLVGTPVLLVDTQAAERRLEEIPWVDVARVRTDFPHGVTIEIRERQAMTTYQGPDRRFRVLDREGRVLDVIDNYPFAYVLLEGPDPVDLEPGEFAPRGYAAASELAKNLTGSVRGRVASIEVTADGSSLVMHLDGGVDVRFGEARDLFAKLVRLETVLSSGETGDSTVIDVSTNEVTL